MQKIKTVVPCYYEESPTKGIFPYAVLSGVRVNDLTTGELASFYVDVWADQKSENSTEQLEAICDKLVNELNNALISKDGVFYGHIGFENRMPVSDTDFDLEHRQLSFSARNFYIGG